MKRYILVSTDLFHETFDDRMAESPADAVRQHWRDFGETSFEFVEHPPEVLMRLRKHKAPEIYCVYEVPGEPLEGGIRTDEHVARLIESMFKPVAVVECVERSHD